jgi:hypothetical protein
MGGGGSNLWSIGETDRWSWFTRKILAFFKKEKPTPFDLPGHLWTCKRLDVNSTEAGLLMTLNGLAVKTRHGVDGTSPILNSLESG